MASTANALGPAAAPEARPPWRTRSRGPHATSTICALVERDRASADQANELAVVGGDEHGRAAGVDLAQQVHDLERQIGIEVAGRFVGEQQHRIVDERARDRDALLLTARQVLRVGVHAVLQPDPLEDLERAAPLVRGRHAEHLGHERDVLEHRAASESA